MGREIGEVRVKRRGREGKGVEERGCKEVRGGVGRLGGGASKRKKSKYLVWANRA